jgi:DUF4097 and DUF4098 domain-containing protein YvlB
MRYPRFTVAMFVIALWWVACAEEWSKTYTITGKPDLRVDTSDANIRVDTWDKNVVEAHVTTQGYKIGQHGIQIYEHQTGDSVELEVRYPHHHNFGIVINTGAHHHRVDIEIHMPREGRARLHTGDGRIQLGGLKGDMETTSGDGHQEIQSVEGRLRAHAGDGHIRASGRFDTVDISTGDGPVEATALPGSRVSQSWTLHTGDGGVTLHLPDTLAADVELHSGDGHITVDLPLTVSGRLRTNRIHGKLNGGGNLLTVHTGDGSIHLEKS